MRVVLLFIFCLGIFPSIQAQNICGSASPCENQANAFGTNLIFAAAAIGPHFLLGNVSYAENSLKFVSFGLGQNSSKELSFGLKSPVRGDWLLVTAASVMVFDSSLPSVARYGLGPGFSFKVGDDFLLIPEIKISIEKYEPSAGARFGSQANILLICDVGDRDRFFASPSYSYYSYSVARLDIGYTHHFSKRNSIFSDFTFGPMISFEDNRLLREKLTLFSIVMGLN